MTSRNYGLTQRAGGTDPGAQPQSRLRNAPNVTQRNPSIQLAVREPSRLTTSSLGTLLGKKDQASLPPLPSGSIASSPSFKRRGFLQALIDVAALGAFGLVIGSAAVAAGLLVYAAYLRFVPQFI
jgi:hypothetical protein